MPGIYIHIPFCAKRCNYCDFFFTTNTGLTEEFLSALRTEISISSAKFCDAEFDTIFFGGGTPSLLSSSQLASIINEVKSSFRFRSDAEISLEANPDDLDHQKLEELCSTGINRLSIGVQSFIDSELNFLSRTHTAKKASDAVRTAAEIFDNVSADLIYSIPGQSMESAAFSIQQAIECGVKHLSAYTLTYESGTLLFRDLRKGVITKNNSDSEAELYMHVVSQTGALGLKQYEVSNFAFPGYECRHNLTYWNAVEYLGLGPSAHSFFYGKRWKNRNSVGEYIEMLKSSGLPVEGMTELTADELRSDYIMLALRAGGIDLKNYSTNFGRKFETEYSESISELAGSGYAVLTDEKFSLTSEGYLLADEITARYF